MRTTIVVALLLAVGNLAVGVQENRVNETAEMDAASLCVFFERNPLQVEKTIGNRWVRLRDKVSKVVASEQMGTPAQLILVNPFDSSPSVVECSFAPNQFTALKLVKPGAVVRLRGKLDRFNQTTIYLKNCQLVITEK